MKTFLVAMIVALASASTGQATTIYTNVTAFDAAVGPTTFENFTDTTHFPISTGVLNSFTNLPEIGITPGTILPGVTYSTAIGTGHFFNIDSGLTFTGGFLDTVTGNAPLTVTFVSPESAFGYVTNGFGGTLQTVVINFSHGPSQTFTYTEGENFNLGFIGFQSSSANITGFTLEGANAFDSNHAETFAIDNFQFGAGPVPTPEPPTPLLLGAGLLGLALLRAASNAAPSWPELKS